MIILFSLAALIDGKKTIYAIKKYIEEYFTLFYKPSLGSLHPTLKKLLEQKYLNLVESFTEGGQKKSFYSITKKGKEYFVKLMEQEMAFEKKEAENTAEAKLILLPFIKDQEKTIKSVMNYLEYKKNCLKSDNKYFKLLTEELDRKLGWLATISNA